METYRLQGAGYQPQASDYELLDQAIEEYENTQRSNYLDEPITEILLGIMNRRADYKLDETLTVIEEA